MPSRARCCWESHGRSLLALLATIACGACGPNVEASGSASGSSGADTGTTTGTTASTMSATGGNTTTTTTTTSTTNTTGDDPTTGDDGSSFIMDTYAPDVPPGADCEPAQPVPAPPLPDGCVHAWLVDANSNPIDGAYSGVVRCGSLGTKDEIAYRSTAVACPDLVGDDCLCDADCERGYACICANEAIDPWVGQPASNRCMPADCTGPEDCGGLPCRMDLGSCVGAFYAESFRCTSEGDDCLYPSECGVNRGTLCDYDELNELFTCNPGAICE